MIPQPVRTDLPSAADRGRSLLRRAPAVQQTPRKGEYIEALEASG